MADPAVQAAHVEAHHAAARVLRSWPEKTGIPVRQAGVVAELAVEAAWPIIAALIRAQAFTEAADKVGKLTADDVTFLPNGHNARYNFAAGWNEALERVRGLGEETENA